MADNRDLVRAATYEQVRADLKGSQRGKTSKKVECNPPNVKCGGRCIPPTWDCRLKGEGTNSELKVHAQDISAGVASLQRGGVDVAKGVVGLNPARFERGRRSIIRGAVKIAPGDNLEKKKQLRRRLEQNSNLIAGVVTVGLAATGGYLVGRKLVPPGVRAKWEKPAVAAFNQVLDQAPLIGGRRAQRRQAAEMAATSLGGALTREVRKKEVDRRAEGNVGGIGPLGFRSQSANTKDSGLKAKLSEIDNEKRSFESWKQEATQALFGAKSNGHSIFSERATNEYLVSQYGLQESRKYGAVNRGTGNQGGTQGDRNKNVKNALASKLETIGADMKIDAAQRGYPATDLGRKRYIKDVALAGVSKGLGKMSALQKKNALDTADAILNDAMGGRHVQRASAIHKETVENYDVYFNRISGKLQRFAGNPVNADSPLGDANVALARYTRGRSTGTSPQIFSRSHADLMLREHYHTNVANSTSGYIVSESTAKRIAQQITRSTTTPTTEAAYKTLNANGFPYARSGKNATPAVKAPPKTGLRAQQNLAALARKIQAREGNEGMSYEAALRAARKEQKRRDSARGDDEHMSPTITKRNPPQPLVTNSTPTVVNGPTSSEHLPKDEDEMVTPLMPVSKMSESPSPKEAEQQEPQPKATGTVKLSFNLELPASAVMGKVMQDSMPPRVASYLQMREDLRGKPCGASHIPKPHNCTKNSESEAKSGGVSGKKIAAAVLVGSVGAIAVAAASDAYQLNNGLGMPDTPGMRTAIRPHLNGGKGSDPAVMQAALGSYYDKQAKEQGWKVGDLVYSKTKNEPTSHFAVYMGKNKEGAHAFAMMGVDGLSSKTGGITIFEAGTGAKNKTGMLYAKAPSNRQPEIKYSPDEIANRVNKLMGKKLDYDTFNANCESWANMIVSGKARSTQSERLTLVGKTAIRGVYNSLEVVAKLDDEYPAQIRSGERIKKVARWLDTNNPRGNDLGYQAMVKRNGKYRKDAEGPEDLGLIDPSTVIKENMSDIEAVSATKRWLMVLTAITADGPA